MNRNIPPNELPVMETLWRPAGLPVVHVRRARQLPPDRAVGLRVRRGTPDPDWDTEPIPADRIDARIDSPHPEDLLRAVSDLLERYAIDRMRIDAPGVSPPTEPVGKVELVVDITGLRNAKGVCAVTLFAGPAGFPGDPAKALSTRTVGIASESAPVHASASFPDIAPGVYAVAVLHDENSNGRLDTFLGIPREGFAFSGSAVVRTGPPKFDACRFFVADSSPIRRLRIATTYLAR
jgi:uncharacterized protein (DUF2141 family)